MCVGAWSQLGYVKDSDIAEVVMQPEIPEEGRLAEGWYLII